MWFRPNPGCNNALKHDANPHGNLAGIVCVRLCPLANWIRQRLGRLRQDETGDPYAFCHSMLLKFTCFPGGPEGLRPSRTQQPEQPNAAGVRLRFGLQSL